MKSGLEEFTNDNSLIRDWPEQGLSQAHYKSCLQFAILTLFTLGAQFDPPLIVFCNNSKSILARKLKFSDFSN